MWSGRERERERERARAHKKMGEKRTKRRVRLKNWQIRRSDVIGVSVISVLVVVRLKNKIAPVPPRRYCCHRRRRRRRRRRRHRQRRRYHRRQGWRIRQNDNFVLAMRAIWLNRLDRLSRSLKYRSQRFTCTGARLTSGDAERAGPT